MNDWRGIEIVVGAIVVYPSRQSSSLWMSEGVVVTVEPGKIGVKRTRTRYSTEPSTRVSYPAPERITVIS